MTDIHSFRMFSYTTYFLPVFFLCTYTTGIIPHTLFYIVPFIFIVFSHDIKSQNNFNDNKIIIYKINILYNYVYIDTKKIISI